MSMDAETALAFAVHENPGVFALLLGSGVSRAAAIPTGYEVTLDLVRKVAALEGVTGKLDLEKWYLESRGEPPEYSKLLDQLAHSQDERRAILHGYIEAKPEDVSAGRRVPTMTHRAIARLVAKGFVRVILTTNFDRLLENALREVGVDPVVIASDDDLSGAIPFAHSRCWLVKLHGDYLDARIKNTQAELDGYSDRMNAMLDRILDEHGLIVSGWSGEWDGALRSAIRRAPNRRYQMYWAARGELKADARDLFASRGGQLIPIKNADAFFGQLESKVSILSALHSPNPRSTDLLVARVKSLLPLPEKRIELEDLIKPEIERLLASLASPELRPNASWSADEFVRQVALYEAATEPLARIFGVLGRWGSGEDATIAILLIKRLARWQVVTGMSYEGVWLQAYPAILLTYALGLGRLRGLALGDVHNLLRTPITTPFDGMPKAFVKVYFLEKWLAGSHDFWWSLPEFSSTRSAAPLSDHLHRLFRQWSHDYTMLADQFDALFGEFELLGSLLFTAETADKQKLQSVLASEGMHYIPDIPVGQIGFNRDLRREILDRWLSEPTRVFLYEAGFVSDVEYLRLAITNLQRLTQQMRSGHF